MTNVDKDYHAEYKSWAHDEKMSKKELFNYIECCLWAMIDTYNYWNSIDSNKLCQDFIFWDTVKDLCAIEWDRLKTELIVLVDLFVPKKTGLLWHFFSCYKLDYEWPGVYELVLRGSNKNTREYNCLINLFNNIEKKTKPYQHNKKWYYPSKFIYVDYNKLTDSFQIHMMR